MAKTKPEKKTNDDLLLEVIRRRVVAKNEAAHPVSEEPKEKKADKTEKKTQEERAENIAEQKKSDKKVVSAKATVTTPIDDLYDTIMNIGKIRMDIAAKKFNVAESIIEEWAKILEENGLIEIRYPAVGKPSLAKKSK